MNEWTNECDINERGTKSGTRNQTQLNEKHNEACHRDNLTLRNQQSHRHCSCDQIHVKGYQRHPEHSQSTQCRDCRADNTGNWWREGEGQMRCGRIVMGSDNLAACKSKSRQLTFQESELEAQCTLTCTWIAVTVREAACWAIPVRGKYRQKYGRTRTNYRYPSECHPVYR